MLPLLEYYTVRVALSRLRAAAAFTVIYLIIRLFLAAAEMCAADLHRFVTD
ncbi:MAG TPA: hypothetical protein VGL91_02585 [Acidobacteriota bacterium]